MLWRTRSLSNLFRHRNSPANWGILRLLVSIASLGLHQIFTSEGQFAANKFGKPGRFTPQKPSQHIGITNQAMRIVMRIHPGHDLDPLGRHPGSRSIAAKAFDWLRNRADRTVEHHGEDTGAIILAEGIWAGELIGSRFVAGLDHDARDSLGQIRQINQAEARPGVERQLCTPVARTVFQIIVRCCM